MVVPHTIPAKCNGMTAGNSAFETISADYRAKVNGLDCEVYTARVSAMPFNRWWPGHQRPIDQTELASIMSFQADEKVSVSVENTRPFASAVVRPLSGGIVPAVSGNGVSFSIEKPGQYVLEFDGWHKALHIFVNPVEETSGSEKATWYFGEGIHFPGLVRLKDGDRVYLDKGAVVYGSLFGRDVKDITISGYGILDGSYEERLFEHCYEDFTKGNIKFYNSRNIDISGVTLRNSAIWVLNLFGCSDVKIDNIKIVGQWRYNTDGIDVVNSQNVEIKNSFIRSFDDTITLKGIDAYAGRNVTNVHVDNCVLWCGWGRTCEIGLETAAKEYRDIIFENCDLIHNSGVCLDIQNGDYADVHDVIFRNLRIEYQKDTLPEILQQKDEEAYNSSGSMGTPVLIWASNPRFREMYSFLGIEAAQEGPTGKSGKTAAVFDILYENIDVFLEDGVPMPKSEISSRISGTDFYNIKIRGIRINGKPVKSFEELNLEINERVHDITIEQGTRTGAFSGDLLRNTVPSRGQVKDRVVRFHYKDDSRLKVLFIGNSITLHGKAPDIGWYGEWGMAASAEEKDYVHLVTAGLEKRYGPVSFCLALLAEWERNYNNEGILEPYRAARIFEPDIIIVRIGENVNRDILDQYSYKDALIKMIRFFNPDEKAKVVVTDMFWKSEALDKPSEDAAREQGYEFVSISDLGEDDTNKAIGLFEHSGVASHPGNLGMEKIGARILKRLV